MAGETEPAKLADDDGRSARRWRHTVVCVALGAGLLAFVLWDHGHLFGPAFSVQVEDAVVWSAPEVDQVSPVRTEVTITLENRHRRQLADAEVILDSWVDDRGRNLLIHEVPSRQYKNVRGYRVEVRIPRSSWGGGAAVAPLVGSPEAKELSWSLATPSELSEGAESVDVKGRIALVVGRRLKTQRIEASQLEPESSFRVGDQDYIVADVKEYDTYRSITLQTSGYRTPLKRVWPLDARGKVILRPSYTAEWGLCARDKVSPAADQIAVRYLRIESPRPRSGETLEFEYWSEVERLEIPFAGTVPLQRRRYSPSGLRPFPRTRVPIDAWAQEVSGESNPLFQVLPLHVDVRRGRYPELEVAFCAKSPAPLTITSYDVRLTGCRDSRGNALLGSPARSAISEGWELFWGSANVSDASTRKDPVFTVRTNRMPSEMARSVTYEGVLRVKVGEKPESVEVRDVFLGEGASFDIGPVEFTLDGWLENSVRFVVRGDLGVIRELSIISPTGKILASKVFDEPHLYWSNTSVDHMELISRADRYGAAIRGAYVTIKATYLSEAKHYIVPFEVTVPLPAEPPDDSDEAKGPLP